LEFRERKVLVLVRSRPFGKILNFEGWRAAVGMYGMDHHPTLLFIGDGVYSMMKTIDDKPIRMFKSTYEGFGGRLCVSKRSLEERGIAREELFDRAEVLDSSGIGALLTENEIAVTF
jgi:sulfur relay (sulfurtransferase) DsrF/TusC family protein